MKKLRLLIALAGFAAFAGCKSAPPIVNNVVSSAIDCAAPKVHDLAIELIPTVETIVAKRGDGWQDDLLSLIKQNAEEAVACALNEIAGIALKQSTAAPDDALSDVVAKRSQAFIAQRGYRFAAP